MNNNNKSEQGHKDAEYSEWTSLNKFKNKNENEWNSLKNRLPTGDIVNGVVVHRERFGVFVDLGEEFIGLLEIPSMIYPEGAPRDTDVRPEIGVILELKIIGFSDSNRQVMLAM